MTGKPHGKSQRDVFFLPLECAALYYLPDAHRVVSRIVDCKVNAVDEPWNGWEPERSEQSEDEEPAESLGSISGV